MGLLLRELGLTGGDIAVDSGLLVFDAGLQLIVGRLRARHRGHIAQFLLLELGGIESRDYLPHLNRIALAHRKLGEAPRGLKGEVDQRQFQISRHLNAVAGTSELPGPPHISQDAGGNENDDKDDPQ